MMKFLQKVLVLLFAGIFVYGGNPSITSKPVSLSSLPGLVDALLKAEPGEKEFDGPMVIEAHKRFIESLDPEKAYFLEEEVFPFLDPVKQNLFVTEVKERTFQSYKEIVRVFQKAITRSRSLRTTLHGENYPRITGFPKTIEELEAKIFWLFAVSPDKRNSKQTVADLEQHEAEWSSYNEELIARTILKSMLALLDVNSDVMGRRDARAMKEKLTKEAVGTGVICEAVQNTIRVAHIQKGSPAEKIGMLQKGDILLTIDGKPCSEMSIEEIDELLRAKESGSVFLEGKNSKGTTFEQRVPARPFILEEDRVQGEVYRDILVLKIPSLYTNERGVSTSEDMAKILEEAMPKKQIAGVLLDLRGNGGGYLTEAVNTCGLFLRTGVVMMAVYANGQDAVYRDTDPRVWFDGPIVILTSERTASAAEIVAQTLKDYGKAIIVGPETTFGKGSIQMQTVTNAKSPNEIPLKYTVGKFYSVSGVSPNGKGVRADIVLPGFQKSPSKGLSAANLPDVIPAHFKDTLDDIQGSQRESYRQWYLPYLQEREVKYRKLIPWLKKKSLKRQKKEFLDPLLYVHATSSGEKEALTELISTLQLQEAENILEDLIHSSIERKGGS